MLCMQVLEAGINYQYKYHRKIHVLQVATETGVCATVYHDFLWKYMHYMRCFINDSTEDREHAFMFKITSSLHRISIWNGFIKLFFIYFDVCQL